MKVSDEEKKESDPMQSSGEENGNFDKQKGRKSIYGKCNDCAGSNEPD